MTTFDYDGPGDLAVEPVAVAPLKPSRLAEVLGRDPSPEEEVAFRLGFLEGVNSVAT